MPWVGHGITDCTGILNANTVILIGAKFIILKRLELLNSLLLR